MGVKASHSYAFAFSEKLPEDLIKFFQELDDYNNVSNIQHELPEAPDYEFFKKHEDDWYRLFSVEFYSFRIQWQEWPNNHTEYGKSFLIGQVEHDWNYRYHLAEDFIGMLKPFIIQGFITDGSDATFESWFDFIYCEEATH